MLRLLHVVALHGTPYADVLVGDARAYDAWARTIAAGDVLGHGAFYQAPLYPYLLGAVYALGGGPDDARVLQALLGGAACVLLALGTRRFFGARAALAAAALLAVYAPAIFAAGLLQKGALDVALVAALIAQLGPSGLAGPPFACGLVLGALSLSRENALLLVPLLALDVLRTRGRRDGALLVAGALALLLPVAARNLALGGSPLPTTSQAGPNFYIGNHAGADGRYAPLRAGRGDARYEAEDARALAEAARGRALGPGEVSAYWLGASARWIAAHPVDWLALLARKLALALHAREVPDTDALEAHRGASWVLQLTTPAGFLPVLVLAAWGIVVAGRGAWRLHALAFFWLATLVAFFVLGRYRLPLAVTLMPLAGAGLARLSQLRAAAPWPRLVPVAAAVVALLPLAWRDPRAANVGAIGVALDDAGRTGDAEPWLARAVALSPGFADARLAHANVLLKKGDLAAGRQELEEVLRLAPSSAQARQNLAAVLAMQGDLPGAARHLDQLLQLEPGRVDAWVNLARVRAQSGDLAGARSAIDRALALRPDDADARLLRDDLLRAAERP